MFRGHSMPSGLLAPPANLARIFCAHGPAFGRYSNKMSAMPASVSMNRPLAVSQAGFLCAGCGSARDPGGPVLTSGRNQPFDLWRCPDCTLVQRHPRPTVSSLAAQYDEDYYVFTESSPQRWSRAVQQYVVHLSALEGQVGKRLLDVGCALGHFSALARARGWRPVALDISAHAASEASAKFGLEVRAGSLARHRDTLAPFDVVFIGDCIEHVSEPRRFLEDVARILVPGGHICIDTPNWGSRWRRWGGKSWLGLNPFHIQLFDAESLARLLESCGFKSVETRGYTNYRYQSWSTRPEVSRFVSWLPRFISWRVARLVGRFGLHSEWKSLLDRPPESIDAAASCTSSLAEMWLASASGNLSADNLIASAIRA
jgi:2-polyprenyl-3-methyl-5-hydroxy-6-metoxy-1,4-benzoquinol methylase